MTSSNEWDQSTNHSFIACLFGMPVSLSACSYQWHTNRTNGANREASLTSRYPLLTGRLVLAFWQFVCLCILDMCGSVSVKRDKNISLRVGFRAQNNNRSTDNVRSRLPLVRAKFRFARHFDYPGYQRFFLACDGELRFVGRRPTRVRPKAEDTSGETTHFLRLDRKRKPRMKSLWHPGYIFTGYVNNRSHYYVSREQVSFFTSCFCLLIRIIVSELKFFWPVTKLGNRPKVILSSGFTLFWNGMWNDDFKFLLRYLLCLF